MESTKSSESKSISNRFADPIEVRRTILGMLYRGQASHLGTNMSAVEMLISMFGSVDLKRIKNKTQNRSRIIVSKGHCAAATYATMAHYGLLDFAELENYHKDDPF